MTSPCYLLKNYLFIYGCARSLSIFKHIKKQRHSLPTKVCLVKAMVFPVVMYGCESWTIKKAEHRRVDALEP